MKYINLTEEHRSKLLEMCKVLFPEYKEIYWNSGKGSTGSNEHIGFGVQHPTVTHWIDYTYIHWFEFCVTRLQIKLYRELAKISKIGVDTWNHNLIGTIYFHVEVGDGTTRHPVDYLYEKFKLLK